MSFVEISQLALPVVGLVWVGSFGWLFLWPSFTPASSAATMEDVPRPGKAKREALLVPDSQWNGIDTWLDAWRGRPWEPRTRNR
jgi:hypothetical protein